MEPQDAKITGVVKNITFKGVHYEILVETENRIYKVQTTDYAEAGREVGLKFVSRGYSCHVQDGGILMKQFKR